MKFIAQTEGMKPDEMAKVKAELKRKDKALAEAAALILLQKKTSDILGG